MAIVEKLFWQLGTHFLVAITVVEMFDKNSQCMGCLPGQKSGCCREVVVVEMFDKNSQVWAVCQDKKVDVAERWMW